MKIILIVVGVILPVLLGFLMYVRMSTKAVIYSGLSDRGKEYLQLKRDTNDREWQNTTLGKPSARAVNNSVKAVEDAECFSLQIPIPASEVRREGDCQYRFILSNPVGEAVVFKREVTATIIDEVADVSMRRLYTDIYTEKEVVGNGRTFLTFKKKEGLYERSAFLFDNKQLFVLSVVVQTNENLDESFDETLRSVTVYNE